MRKFLCISMIICCLFLLASCWSSRELTDLAIATALGVDMENDQFKVTVQMLNPNEVAGKESTTRSAVTIFTATGNTMFEAIRKLTTVAPRKLYFGHIRIVVFGEEYAENGIGESLDFISRDHEMRTDFLFAIVKEQTAASVLKILTPLERISANKIYTSLKDSQDAWAPTKVVQLDELISSMTSKGKEAVLTGLYVEGSPEEGTKLSNVERVDLLASIQTNNLGVFQGDKLIGWLNSEESKGFNYITNNVRNTVDWVTCGNNGKMTAEIMKAKTKLTADLKGITPKMNIKTMIDANIGDVECNINLLSEKEIKELEKKLGQKIKQIMQSSISRVKEFKVDVFGFGEKIEETDYTKWKQMEKDWNRIFSNELDVQIKVDAKFHLTGTTSQPFFKMIEEKKDKEG